MNDCVIYLVLLYTSGVPVLKLISSCHYHIDGVSWFQGLFDTFVSLSGPKAKEMTYSQAICHKWHSLVALTSTSGCGIVLFSRPGSGEILFISGRYLSILGSFFIVVVSWLMFWASFFRAASDRREEDPVDVVRSNSRPGFRGDDQYRIIE